MVSRPDPWSASVFLLAGVLAIPVCAVAGVALFGDVSAWTHLAETVLGTYLKNSLWLALGVGTGTLLIGTTTAWLTALCDFPGRRLLSWLLILPLALPAYIIAYSYTGVLDFAGPVQTGLRSAFGWDVGEYYFPEIRSLPGAIAVITLVLYPYVYLLTRASFLGQSASAVHVARSLGLTPLEVFRRVSLPLARPAAVTGVALVLMETLADYGTVKYFGVATFTTGIFRTWFGMGDAAAAAQLAASLLALMLLLIALERLSRRRQRFHRTESGQGERYRLTGWSAGVAVVWCSLPVLLGFLIPALQLGGWSLETFPEQWSRGFPKLIGSSLTVASVAAVMTVAASALLAFGHRLSSGAAVTGAVRLAGAGYAVPGTVIAVGVIIPFAWLDGAIDTWLRDRFGVSTGLLLSGTLVSLLFAYLVRFLAVALQTLEAGTAAIPGSMDDTARSLGTTRTGLLARVHLPLLRNSLLTASLLVFVDVMKELPATLILRPFDFNTLAVRAFELAEDEQLAAAAPSALAIVVVGLLPVLLLARGIRHTDDRQR